jgi:hypothetical protein
VRQGNRERERERGGRSTGAVTGPHDAHRQPPHDPPAPVGPRPRQVQLHLAPVVAPRLRAVPAQAAPLPVHTRVYIRGLMPTRLMRVCAQCLHRPRPCPHARIRQPTACTSSTACTGRAPARAHTYTRLYLIHELCLPGAGKGATSLSISFISYIISRLQSNSLCLYHLYHTLFLVYSL